MSQQQVMAICLLNLSAALDTIDHSILLHRLSTWFGFNGNSISELGILVAYPLLTFQRQPCCIRNFRLHWAQL